MGGGSESVNKWNGLTVGVSSARSTNSVGINLNTTTINSGAGNIYMAGRSNSTNINNNFGIFLNGGSINSTSGMIDLTGIGGDLLGSSTNCDGLRIGGIVQSEAGNIRFSRYSNTPTITEGIALDAGASIKSTSGGSISLLTNIIYFNSAARLQSSGTLAIYPTTPAIQIGVGGATGTLSLPADYFTTNIVDGFSRITLGDTYQTGNINMNSITFRDNMRLQTASPAKVVVTAGNTLTLNAGVKLTIDNKIELQTGAKIVKRTQ